MPRGCSFDPLLDGRNRLTREMSHIDGRAVDSHLARLKLRDLQEPLDDDFQTVAGLGNRQQELVALFACQAAFVPQQRGRVALDGGQGTAQLVADRPQQFRLQQFHALQRFAHRSALEFLHALFHYYAGNDRPDRIGHQGEHRLAARYHGSACFVGFVRPSQHQERVLLLFDVRRSCQRYVKRTPAITCDFGQREPVGDPAGHLRRVDVRICRGNHTQDGMGVFFVDVVQSQHAQCFCVI